MEGKKKGLYGDERECWLCHSTNVHKHHIYPGSGRRDISEREGCWLYLCPEHHNMSDFGIHFDRMLDKAIREDCQRRWEKREGVEGDPEHKAFRSVFYESYL